MSSNIIMSGSITMSNSNTPTRAGQRISSIDQIKNVPAPYIGLIIYVEDEDYFIYVKSLKSKKVGNFEIKNALIDEYDLLTGNANNLIWNEVL